MEGFFAFRLDAEAGSFDFLVGGLLVDLSLLDTFLVSLAKWQRDGDAKASKGIPVEPVGHIDGVLLLDEEANRNILPALGFFKSQGCPSRIDFLKGEHIVRTAWKNGSQ